MEEEKINSNFNQGFSPFANISMEADKFFSFDEIKRRIIVIDPENFIKMNVLA